MRNAGIAGLAALILTPLTSGPATAAGVPWNLPGPVRVIFDTDMYGDIDDALALAMLHALESRGEIELLAVTISTQAGEAARYVDAIDTFYGRGSIPIGVVSGGVTPRALADSRYGQYLPSPGGVNFTQHIAEAYPRSRSGRTANEDALTLLRRVLADQPDRSVVVIGVGYLTNLARLLDSGRDGEVSLDGRSLVERKVRFLSVMAGNFAADGAQEFNVEMDVPAARRVFAQWPTPIVVSGSEVGSRILFPQSAIDRYFGYVDRHPIAETYRYAASFYRRFARTPGSPHDHATYDLTSVLHAARPEGGYFTLSAPGTVLVHDDGRCEFRPGEQGRHRLLHLSDAQAPRTLEAMVLLASQPPAHIGSP